LARQHQPAGRAADGAGIIGPADLQLALGGDALHRRLLERGLRLGDVGAGQLADFGADPGHFELSAEDIFVVAIDLDQALIAHHVEIGLGDCLDTTVSTAKVCARAASTVSIACRVCASVRPPR
jgi:hypothetical protein